MTRLRWMALTVVFGAACAAQQVPVGNKAAAPALVEQPDAGRTKDELSNLLDRYPPTLRRVLALDPALLENQAYLAPYPALQGFLNAHPDVLHNPLFYLGNPQPVAARGDGWRELLRTLEPFAGFGMAIGVLVWLVRTFVESRRWKQVAKVHAEVNMKVLERLTSNEELLAYIQSAPGSKFLQSAPIVLDPSPRLPGAPVSRILWAVQGGVVMVAGGIGFQVVSKQVSDPGPLQALGVVAIALGLGFVVSAIISYVISRRLGLLEPLSRAEQPGA